VGNVTKHTATLTEDDYYLVYETQVLAFNIKGDGPKSPLVQIYSSEGCKYALSSSRLFSVIRDL